MKILCTQKRRKIIVSSLNKKNDEIYNGISSYKRLIRITGWIYRFYENSRTCNKKTGELSDDELKKAEITILKKVQDDSFQGEKMQHLKSLSTFTDSNRILRIKTKLIMREDDENFKFPLVLPSEHHVFKSLILYKHQELGHPGVQYLMVALRENYWILKSRRTIKRILKTCIICQRFSVKEPKIPEKTLPEDRVKNASIFEVIGVDIAGPLISKDNKKIWIALFTCAIYRAVHLELLTSL
ncbi:integrase catalytic domain-containing protein [Trichonephila clavipes]|nr:integrase catalytic domain-containing protein [Trichonephila clavipes]